MPLLLASALQAAVIERTIEMAPFSAVDCNGLSLGNGGIPSSLDMSERPEGIPHGTVDSRGTVIEWGRKPRVWRGNQPQPGWTAMLSTGMVYAEEGNHHWDSVHIEIRNLELFIWPRGKGTWCRLDYRATPGGAYYQESFAGKGLPALRRILPGGGLSIKPIKYLAFHFWGNRVALPKEGVNGIYVQYEARLSLSGNARALNFPRFVGAASADYWRALDAEDLPDLVNNEDVAIARFKNITSSWRLFTMNSNGGVPQAPVRN